jgi:hypothetical protein
MYIYGATMNKLKEDFCAGDWTDQDGNKHGYEEQAGVAGPLPAHAADVQRLGRAISRADIKTNVFGSGASSVRRSNPPSVELTVAKALAAAEKRENQTAAASQSKIEEVAYTRAEMVADLKSYENHSGTPLPSVVEEALKGSPSERREYLPSNLARRSVLAAALALWRKNAAVYCSEAHKCSALSESAIDSQVRAEDCTFERRARARARLRARGALVPTPIKRQNIAAAPPTVEPGEGMSAWLEANRNIGGVGQGEGTRGMRGVHDLASTTAGAGNTIALAHGLERRLYRDPKQLSRISRNLVKVARGSAKGGRSSQMQAARTARRDAEIRFLFEERRKASEMDTTTSPWLDPLNEPPAASVGNAVAWKPLPKPPPPPPPPPAPSTPTTG